jgi:endonuclease/exonuclease/phosphatase family metal-dependent hydrolase
MRIATFNIHHGEGMDHVVALDRVARVIADLAPNLLALQEVDQGSARSGDIDQVALLGEMLGMNVRFAPTISDGSFGYGIALAAHEDFEAHTVPLPRVANEEPRVAIVARWKGIGVVATHLSRSAEARRVQTEAVASLVGDISMPSVLLGDLNQSARHLEPILARGLISVPPKRPLLRSLRPTSHVDHILVSEGIIVLRSFTVRTNVSDHDVLVADIRLASDPEASA